MSYEAKSFCTITCDQPGCDRHLSDEWDYGEIGWYPSMGHADEAAQDNGWQVKGDGIHAKHYCPNTITPNAPTAVAWNSEPVTRSSVKDGSTRTWRAPRSAPTARNGVRGVDRHRRARSGAGRNDWVEMRAEQVRLCRLFNARYADGIESPRRRALKEKIERILPELRKITLEANAVCEGERKRLGEAQDRMAEKETIPDIDVDLIDTRGPAHQGNLGMLRIPLLGRSTQMPVLRRTRNPILIPRRRGGVMTELAGLLKEPDTDGHGHGNERTDQ